MLWKRDTVYGVVIIFFAAFMLYKTSQVPLLGDVEPIAGARYYLYPWFALLFLLGISLTIQGLNERKKAIREALTDSQGKEEGKKDRFLPLPTIFTLAVLCLYVFLIRIIGFHASSVLFLFTLFVGYFLFCSENRFRFMITNKKEFIFISLKYLITSVIVVVLIHIVFAELLNVGLPG